MYLNRASDAGSVVRGGLEAESPWPLQSIVAMRIRAHDPDAAKTEANANNDTMPLHMAQCGIGPGREVLIISGTRLQGRSSCRTP